MHFPFLLDYFWYLFCLRRATKLKPEIKVPDENFTLCDPAWSGCLNDTSTLSIRFWTAKPGDDFSWKISGLGDTANDIGIWFWKLCGGKCFESDQEILDVSTGKSAETNSMKTKSSPANHDIEFHDKPGLFRSIALVAKVDTSMQIEEWVVDGRNWQDLCKVDVSFEL